MLRALLLVLRAASTFASAAGSAACPCLTTFDDYGLSSTEPLTATVAEAEYVYPSGYGLAECKTHDAELPPYCSEADAPSWCNDEWCYVDPGNCNLVTSQGTYFTSDLFYSYRTCGNTNTYDNWFGSAAGSSSGGTGSHQLVELVNVTTAYLKATVNALETQELELRTVDLSQGQCSYEPSCDCCGCTVDDVWSRADGSGDNAITFSHTTTTPFMHPVTPRDSPPNIDVCLSEAVSTQFQHVAAKEADTSRVGYEYYGSQLGTYMQWPGVQWCPESYDPRFRNWYAGGVSGPKDMVVVIDTSGSMHGNRIAMAEEAATRVIDTLTESDYAAVVTFSSSAASSSEQLVRMTAAAKATAKSWIASNVQAGGGTNFNAALERVWAVLGASSSSTSQCNRLVLFLSDGEPTDWEEGDYGTAQAAATLHNAHMLTYALGSGADSTKLKRLACENSGIFYPVADHDNLGDTMASYYNLVSPMLEPCHVRYTEYEDWFTGMSLLAACLPAYKRADRDEPLTCAPRAEPGSGTPGLASSSVAHLIGVACMDMSLIASDAQLRGDAGWGAFWSAISEQMKACPRRALSEGALQQLRAEVSATSVCDTTDDSSNSAGAASGGVATSSSYATRTSPPKTCNLPPAPPAPLEAGVVVGIAIGAAVGLLCLGAWCGLARSSARSAQASARSAQASSTGGVAMAAAPPVVAVPIGQPVVAEPPVVVAGQPVPTYSSYYPSV